MYGTLHFCILATHPFHKESLSEKALLDPGTGATEVSWVTAPDFKKRKQMLDNTFASQ